MNKRIYWRIHLLTSKISQKLFCGCKGLLKRLKWCLIKELLHKRRIKENQSFLYNLNRLIIVASSTFWLNSNSGSPDKAILSGLYNSIMKNNNPDITHNYSMMNPTFKNRIVWQWLILQQKKPIHGYFASKESEKI